MKNWMNIALGAAIVLFATAGGVNAQQVVGTPTQSVGDSFFENFGVGFGGRLPGGGFVNGPAPVAGLPGINPAGGANLGFGLRGGGFGLGFNVGAVQGSSRSFETFAPSVTIPNGGTGSIFSGSQQPFVTGIVPVVGGYGVYVPQPQYSVAPAAAIYPLHDKIQRYYANLGQPAGSGRMPPSLPASRALTRDEKLSATMSTSVSSATHGELSVAEIKARRTARLAAEETATRGEIQALVERARGAVAAGKVGVARIYLRQAISRAEGEQRRQLSAELDSLVAPSH